MASEVVVCDLCGEKSCDCEKDIQVYFCPSCKSHDVRYVFGLGNIFGVIPRMKCFNCEYTASSFPILVTNKKKIAKAVSNMRKKNSKKKKVAKKVQKKVVKKARKKSGGKK